MKGFVYVGFINDLYPLLNQFHTASVYHEVRGYGKSPQLQQGKPIKLEHITEGRVFDPNMELRFWKEQNRYQVRVLSQQQLSFPDLEMYGQDWTVLDQTLYLRGVFKNGQWVDEAFFQNLDHEVSAQPGEVVKMTVQKFHDQNGRVAFQRYVQVQTEVEDA